MRITTPPPEQVDFAEVSQKQILKYLNKKGLLPAKMLSNKNLEHAEECKWAINYDGTYEWAVKNADYPLLALLIDSQIPYQGIDKDVPEALDQIKQATEKLVLGAYVPLTFRSMHQWQKEQTPVHNAIKNNNVELLQLLIAAGADLSQQCILRKSPLQVACEEGNIDACRILLQTGLSLTKTEDRPPLLSVLIDTLKYGRPGLASQIKTFLLEQNKLSESNGCPFLHYSIFTNQIQVANALLDWGVQISTLDPNGRPPLCCAIMQHKSLDLIERLIAPNTVNQPDREGYLPLHYAINYGLMKASKLQDETIALNTVELLLDCGADPKAVFAIEDPRIHQKVVLPRNDKTPFKLLQNLLNFNRELHIREVTDIKLALKYAFLSKVMLKIKHALWKRGEFSPQEQALFTCMKEQKKIFDLEEFTEFLINNPYKKTIKEKDSELLKELFKADIIDTEAIFKYMKANHSISNDKEKFISFLSDKPYNFAVKKKDINLLHLLVNAGISHIEGFSEDFKTYRRWVKGKFTEFEEEVYSFLEERKLVRSVTEFIQYLLDDPYGWAIKHNMKPLLPLLIKATIPYTGSDSTPFKMMAQVQRWNNLNFNEQELALFDLIKNESIVSDNKLQFLKFLYADPYGYAVQNDWQELIRHLLKAGIVNTNPDKYVCHAVTKGEQQERWKHENFNANELALYELVKDEEHIVSCKTHFAAFLLHSPISWAIHKEDKNLIEKLIKAEILETYGLHILYEYMQTLYGDEYDIERFAEFLCNKPYEWANKELNYSVLNLLVEADIPNTSKNPTTLNMEQQAQNRLMHLRWRKLRFNHKELEIFKWMKSKEQILDKEDFAEFLAKTPYTLATSEIALIPMLVKAGIPYHYYPKDVVETVNQVMKSYSDL